jgi:hypothetical protein
MVLWRFAVAGGRKFQRQAPSLMSANCALAEAADDIWRPPRRRRGQKYFAARAANRLRPFNAASWSTLFVGARVWQQPVIGWALPEAVKPAAAGGSVIPAVSSRAGLL